MIRVVAILEVMWDWRAMTTGAGYRQEAPRYFVINKQNFSGRRLYKLCGSDASLIVTNACRELVSSAKERGTPNPPWLATNLGDLDGEGDIDVLLVCGRVAQATYKACGYVPRRARVIEIPHPAARQVWTREKLAEVSQQIHGQAVSA